MKPDISNLDHAQLFALWEAVRAASDLFDNFNGQPRFKAGIHPNGGTIWNNAGNIVDGYARELGLLGDAIAQRARSLRPATKEEREYRLMLLIKDEIGVFECTIEEAERAFSLIDSEREGEAA